MMDDNDTIKNFLIGILGEEEYRKMEAEEQIEAYFKMLQSGIKIPSPLKPFPSEEKKNNTIKNFYFPKLSATQAWYFEKQKGLHPDKAFEKTAENTKWQDKTGKFQLICEMTTIHLFNTIFCLIKARDLKYHKPGRPSTAEYLTIMLKEIAKEERDEDLTDEMLEKLANVAHAFKNKLN